MTIAELKEQREFWTKVFEKELDDFVDAMLGGDQSHSSVMAWEGYRTKIKWAYDQGFNHAICAIKPRFAKAKTPDSK